MESGSGTVERLEAAGCTVFHQNLNIGTGGDTVYLGASLRSIAGFLEQGFERRLVSRLLNRILGCNPIDGAL